MSLLALLCNKATHFTCIVAFDFHVTAFDLENLECFPPGIYELFEMETDMDGRYSLLTSHFQDGYYC